MDNNQLSQEASNHSDSNKNNSSYDFSTPDPNQLSIAISNKSIQSVGEYGEDVCEAPRDLSPGMVLKNRFRLDVKLGRGGMGEVWKAFDLTSEIDVALKFVPRDVQQYEKEMARVKEVYKKIRDLSHPHIRQTYYLEQDPRQGYFLVMKWLQGVGLDQLYYQNSQQGKSFPRELIFPLLEALAQALDFSHRQGVIHRDVKPSNIFLNVNNGILDNAWLIDFGLATEIRHSMTNISNKRFETSGTRPYMPPEQWRGQAQNAQTDQYSLAVVAYELYAGHLPFDCQDIEMLRMCIMNDTPKRIKDVPDHINQALQKALSKEPEDRFRSCREFVQALNAESKPITSIFLCWIVGIVSSGIAILLKPKPKSDNPEEKSIMSLFSRWIAGIASFLKPKPKSDNPEEKSIMPLFSRWISGIASFLKPKPKPDNPEEKSITPLFSRRIVGIATAVIAVFLILLLFAGGSKENSSGTEPKKIQTYSPGAVPVNPVDSEVKKELKPGERLVKTVNGVEFAFRWCPAGTFMMGFTKSEWDKTEITWKTYNESQHEVTLSKGFWMLEMEVTQIQWQAIMGRTQADQNKLAGYDSDYGTGPQYPIYRVSWDDCQEFCKKFNSLSGLQIGLPTESQWEYACRAGTTGVYAGDLDSIAWYDDNSGYKTHPVGTKQPNAWGLYDMHGNVWECCSDWYGDYPSGSLTDPTGASSGAYRVIRGGSCYTIAGCCQSAIRYYNLPDGRSSNLGFRPVFVSFDTPAPEAPAPAEKTVTKVVPVKADTNAGDRITRTVKGVEFAFRWCPAGTFTMGSPEGEGGRYSDETQHEVTLSQGFWMLEKQVTQQQWQAIMGNNPSYFKGDNLPVEQVSWDDCQDFCKKFNSLSGLQIGLPTESQWEYACRAGTTGAYAGDLDSMGWFDDNSFEKTHPVGTKQPNAWGLSDMHGNVYEWCSDWYGDYPSGSVTDPTGASSGTSRVIRGGSWNYHARNCRSAFRDYLSPDYRGSNRLGFRPVFVSFVP